MNLSLAELDAVDVGDAPQMRVPPPGPLSRQWHDRGESLPPTAGRTPLMPVAFASGQGCVLVDVDGNQYLDFSSGIYVTTLGHCHPKVTEAVQRAVGTLQNVHRYLTPIKAQLQERLIARLPGDFSGFQFFDSGTTAVEAALRVAREATGKQELISAYQDYHGKTYGASGLSQVDHKHAGPTRAPGCHLVPRPDRYRPHWTHDDGCIDTDRYIEFYDEYRRRATVNDVAAFVLEPIQGWAGTVMPPDDFFPKLRRYCDREDLLLVTDEILTGMGRTGKWLCTEHWEVIPDIVTLGKGLGNGFPVSCVAVREPYHEALKATGATTSYGGNPMACAAALATIDTIETEGLLDQSVRLGEVALQRMERMKAEHPMVGDVRTMGCLMGIELVRDRVTKVPWEAAGELVYKKAFCKGLVTIPGGHILRLSPPVVMTEEALLKGLDIIDESIGEAARDLGAPD